MGKKPEWETRKRELMSLPSRKIESFALVTILAKKKREKIIKRRIARLEKANLNLT